MSTALEGVALASDVSVIRAAELFELEMSRLLGEAGIAQGELVELGRGQAVLRDILEVGASRGDQPVSDSDGVEMARRILVLAARDEQLGRLVEHCLASYPEDRLTVGKSTKVALLAALLLLVATTEVKFERGQFSVHKRSVIPVDFDLEMSRWHWRMKFDEARAEPEARGRG